MIAHPSSHSSLSDVCLTRATEMTRPQSSFMEAVRDQYINEVMSFCRDIYTSLNAADTRKMGNIPAGQVRGVMLFWICGM